MRNQFDFLYWAIFDKLKYAKLETFGSIIKAERIKGGLLLRQVAAFIEVDTSMVSKFEKGERYPTRDQVEKLAILLQIPIDELLVNSLSEKLIIELEKEPLASKILAKASQKIGVQQKSKKK